MNISPVTMILRGYTYEQVKCVAEVLLNSKHVRNMEITLNTKDAYEIIQKISSEYGTRLNVGAGTVQTYTELEKAIQAGASFALSPRMMSKEMLDLCKKNGVISVPGSFTPSEVAESLTNGADIVKIFPATELNLSYAKKLQEPMGKLPLMAVGGINRENVKEAFKCGYEYVGTAGGLFKKEDIQKMDSAALIKELELFEKELMD
jgi:2-dehydro-3-deoxyphosphogluconate aldolase/(4S)-4-hydroxy-2-oxoglutarate aldolase